MQQLFRQIDKDRELVYAWFEAMHTRIDLVLWDTGEADRLSCAVQAIEEETRRIERMGSRFLPYSEVSRINDAAPGCPVCVSDELCALLARCLDYRQRWGGLFDVTACEGVSCRLEEQRLSVCAPYVARADETVRIDLSGCLKGYALDRAVSLLRKQGIGNGLLSFGNSSVFALGNHPKGEGWMVAEADSPDRRHVLHDECLTTSGNNTESRRHIVHPLTGRMVEGRHTASVVTRSGEEGEVLSIVKFLSDSLSASFQDKIETGCIRLNQKK